MSLSSLKRYTKFVDTDSPFIFLIGEVGSSFGSDEEVAFSVVDQLVDAGFSAVKFQIIFADELLLSHAGLQMVEGKEVNLYHCFEEQEQSFDFFLRIAKYCKKKNILFFASIFGTKSLNVLLSVGKEVGFTVVKIASPESHHLLLWNEIAEKIDLIDAVIFSTGMTTEKDLDWLASYLKKIGIFSEKICALQCVTRYPALEEESNVAILSQFKKKYEFFSGFSDHSADSFFIPMLATAYSGAEQHTFFLEKHVSAKNNNHLDSSIAITPEDFKKFAFLTHDAYEWGLNHAKKKYSLTEWSKIYAKNYGFNDDRVINALGVKKIREKVINQREKSIFGATKRSLRCSIAKKKNEEILLEDCLFLRAGGLPAGEGYIWLDRIMNGEKLIAKLDFKAGSPLNDNFCRFV